MTGRKSELPSWGGVVLALLQVVLSWRRGDEGALLCERWLESPQDRDRPPWVHLPTASTRPTEQLSYHTTAVSCKAGFRHKWDSAHLVQSVTAEGFMGRWGAAQPWPIRDDIECLLSPRPVALGFDRGSVSEKRPTQVERRLDRHKHKPLVLRLVCLGKAGSFSASELCVTTFVTSSNVVHKKTFAKSRGHIMTILILFSGSVTLCLSTKLLCLKSTVCSDSSAGPVCCDWSTA